MTSTPNRTGRGIDLHPGSRIHLLPGHWTAAARAGARSRARDDAVRGTSERAPRASESAGEARGHRRPSRVGLKGAADSPNPGDASTERAPRAKRAATRGRRVRGGFRSVARLRSRRAQRGVRLLTYGWTVRGGSNTDRGYTARRARRRRVTGSQTGTRAEARTRAETRIPAERWTRAKIETRAETETRP